MTCIKGSGFDNQTGGFAAILVDGKEVPKSVIAAAPDLLAALELAVAEWDAPNGMCDSPLTEKKARAAILKARGED